MLPEIDVKVRTLGEKRKIMSLLWMGFNHHYLAGLKNEKEIIVNDRIEKILLR